MGGVPAEVFGAECGVYANKRVGLNDDYSWARSLFRRFIIGDVIFNVN